MAFDLTKDVKSSRPQHPPCIVVHGMRGEGKTTFASSFPKPFLLNVEKGTPKGIDIPSNGVATTYQEVLDVLSALIRESHDYKTLIIDTIDVVESLVQTHLCEKKNWDSIAAPGYGMGYAEVREEFSRLMKGINLIQKKGMCVVILAHTAIRAYSNPNGPDYMQFDIGMNKTSSTSGPGQIICDLADAVLFLQLEPKVVGAKENEKYSSPGKAAGTGEVRFLHTSRQSSIVAKNPWEMPAKIFLPKKGGYLVISKYFLENTDENTDENTKD